MTLQLVSQAVAEHLGDNANPTDRGHEKLARYGKITGLIGIGMVILLLISTFACLAISKVFGLNFESFGFDFFAPIVLAIALPLLFAGATMAIYPIIAKEFSHLKTAELPQVELTGKLPAQSHQESLSSITEYTPELLESSDVKDQEPKQIKKESA